jgi:hypothetical protein
MSRRLFWQKAEKEEVIRRFLVLYETTNAISILVFKYFSILVF